MDYVAAQRKAGMDYATIRKTLDQFAESASPLTPSEVHIVSHPWTEPEPLGRFNLPGFPLNAFPVELQILADYCAAVAESYQVPIDLPATLSLSTGAASLARRCEVHVSEDWWEPLNIYGAVAMEPGERKSAVFRVVTSPLTRFEQEESARLAEALDQNHSELRILDAALKAAEKAASTAKDATKRDEARARARGLLEQIRSTPRMYTPRMLADDATPEALAKLMFEQGGRIALMSPEGGVFEQMAGRYSDNITNLDVYLKAHAGDDMRIDRVSRPPEDLKKPALTIGLAVQPEVLRGLASKPGFRGRGLLARFLYVMPRSLVGYRDLNPRTVPNFLAGQYQQRMRRALELPAASDADGHVVPYIIGLDDDAKSELDRFRNDVEIAMRAGGPLAGLKDWAAKLPGAVVRVGGIMHGLICSQDCLPNAVLLSGPTMQGAIALGNYLIEHARAAFFEMGADKSIGLARLLLEWVQSRRIDKFTRREAYRNIRSHLTRVDAVDDPLRLLVEHGYIRALQQEREGPGRPASPGYEVNPLTLGHNCHNGQNSHIEGNSGISVHSVPESEIQNHATIAETGAAESLTPAEGTSFDQSLDEDVASANEALAQEKQAIETTEHEANP